MCMISYSKHPDARLHRYALALHERNDMVDIICIRDKGEPLRESFGTGTVYRIQERNYNERLPLTYLLRLSRFLVVSTAVCTFLYFKKRYDVIHFHNIPDFGIFCTLIPRLMGAEVILDIHDLVPEYYMRKFSLPESHWIIYLLKKIEKLSSSYAHHVITVTDIWRDRLVQRSCEPSKCSVILNAPLPELFHSRRPGGGSTNGRFVISYHGNLIESTGVDIGIRAVAMLTGEIPNIEFRIMGKGRELETLKKLAKELGVENHVHFLKPRPVQELPEILSTADIGLDTKRDGVYAGETLSVKAMEYLALQVPLVASKTRAAQHYFEDSHVMFFNPGDPEDLARGILELYRSPEKRRQLAKNSKEFIRKYHWDIYKARYYHILDGLVKKHRKT